ncbi:PE family protein [Mycobacterium tuberculosis]|uniref:PE family protein n=1 Tax=Mycobacterium tuberculosis TaxID=1773 RepID=UPI0018F5F18E|nr:PE family protein [Mycobacterium tuberculosis]
MLIARPDILCSRGPEAMRAKAADLDLAAAAKTVGVQPAADQVAAAIAAILLSHAQIYQDISTQMAAFHDQLVENRTADSTSYASAEANAQQSLLNAMDAPSWQQRRETVGEVGLPADPAGSGTATAAVAAATTARAGSRSAAQATVAPIGGVKQRRGQRPAEPAQCDGCTELATAPRNRRRGGAPSGPSGIRHGDGGSGGGDDGAGRKPFGRPGNRGAYRRAETPPRICAKPAG